MNDNNKVLCRKYTKSNKIIKEVKEIKQGIAKLRGKYRLSKTFTINQLEIIFGLKKDAQMLKDLNYIMNVCLFNGAYSEKNLEQRINQMRKIKVPQWEQNILNDATDINKKLSVKIFDQLQQLIREIKIVNKW